jgi:pyrrolidone-carboxylate peptidase
MHHLARNRSRVRGGFIHVPPLADESSEKSGLTLEVMVKSIWLAIETSLALRRDIRDPSGTIA